MKIGRYRLSSRQPLIVGVIVLITVLIVGIYIASKLSQPTPPLPPMITIVFDFDTGSPILTANQITPFSQTSKGLTANFSSPSDPAAFSVKNTGTESFKLSQFSGKYIYDNNPSRDILDVKFSSEIAAIYFTFATVEYQSETITLPSDILVTAYRNNNLAGSNTTYGTFSSDSFPQGVLTFNSGTLFNWIRISIPSQTSETTDFLVDDITILMFSKPPST